MGFATGPVSETRQERMHHHHNLQSLDFDEIIVSAPTPSFDITSLLASTKSYNETDLRRTNQSFNRPTAEKLSRCSEEPLLWHPAPRGLCQPPSDLHFHHQQGTSRLQLSIRGEATMKKICCLFLAMPDDGCKSNSPH